MNVDAFKSHRVLSGPIVPEPLEVIEPYHGRILDPACGSGGRGNCEVRSSSCEVLSIRHSPFAIRNLPRLSIHGVEKTDETGRLCRLVAVRKDLAVHGLEGEIKHGGNINSYYDDPRNLVTANSLSNH